MPSFVAFLRAVNVPPRFVRMADGRRALESDGFVDVQTHIQSGNVSVTTPLRSRSKAAAALTRTVSETAGFPAPALVRTPAQVRALVGALGRMPPLLGGPTPRAERLTGRAMTWRNTDLLRAIDTRWGA